MDKDTDNKICYMILDDTVDIGKEPLPIESEKDKAFFEYAKKLVKECMKEK
ncbi:MAG: hypothetical protein Q4B32_11670 [Clostridia bacterium]|nr:hypothetical protein [Clostridia bacterium]